jgi:hypothetical protein
VGWECARDGRNKRHMHNYCIETCRKENMWLIRQKQGGPSIKVSYRKISCDNLSTVL